MTPRRPRLVALVAGVGVLTARALVVLSAPEPLAMADEATWKHAAVARALADGQEVRLDCTSSPSPHLHARLR